MIDVASIIANTRRPRKLKIPVPDMYQGQAGRLRVSVSGTRKSCQTP
jgi:hypothetical protein